MKICAFCQKQLGGGTQAAQEHVLNKGWLRELGHLQTQITLPYHRDGILIETRRLVAEKFRASEVCAGCNNGWMRETDEKVRGCVLSLARGERALSSLDSSEKAGLTRWVFKTALVVVLNLKKGFRDTPQSFFKAAKEGKLPAGFVAFAIEDLSGQKTVNFASSAFWAEFASRPSLIRQIKPFKMAFQYDRLIIGSAFPRANEATSLFSVPASLTILSADASAYISGSPLSQIQETVMELGLPMIDEILPCISVVN